MDIKDLKRLSGLNEGEYDSESTYDPNIALDKLASQLIHLPEEIINHATNLSSEAEMNDVLEYFAKQLEKAAAKLRQ